MNITFTINRETVAETIIALREREVMLIEEARNHPDRVVRAIASQQLIRVRGSLEAFTKALMQAVPA